MIAPSRLADKLHTAMLGVMQAGVRYGRRAIAALLLAASVAATGACNGMEHGQAAVETRLAALDGVDTVSAHAGLEFPESLDRTLDSDATPEHVDMVLDELPRLTEKSGLPADWTAAKYRVQ